VQCPYCSLNILFADKLATKFATLGDTATRQELDTGVTANDEGFWKTVQVAFTSLEEESYNQLKFTEDPIMADMDHVDPSVIVNHDWRKIRSIWKGICADYKAPIGRFTISGTHDSSFYTFCNGKKDIYYLHKYLKLHPELNDTIKADLPSTCALSLESPLSEESDCKPKQLYNSRSEKMNQNNKKEQIVQMSLLVQFVNLQNKNYIICKRRIRKKKNNTNNKRIHHYLKNGKRCRQTYVCFAPN
jgi:hypothetical protein